jgi:hypothetical protein
MSSTLDRLAEALKNRYPTERQFGASERSTRGLDSRGTCSVMPLSTLAA